MLPLEHPLVPPTGRQVRGILEHGTELCTQTPHWAPPTNLGCEAQLLRDKAGWGDKDKCLFHNKLQGDVEKNVYSFVFDSYLEYTVVGRFAVTR